MSVNKIKISTSTRKILNKTKRTLGMKGENLEEVLLFDLDKKIEGNAIVEIELPNGAQSFVELAETEDGYELPVKSVLTEQVGFVKFQLRILQNKVEVFKSEIFELEVKESLNAIYEEPDEYPTWIDNLETLKSDLEQSEKERVSNENERIESEETRKENFTQMQESVKSAISNIEDLTEDYNSNATEKLNEFNDNYSETIKSFNDNAETKYDNYNKNAESKVAEYNKNNDEKLKAYNDNHTTKITNFNTNAKSKIDEYDKNASKKLEDYNSNDTTKIEKYNENATTKLNDYDTNATTKKEEYDTNTENKIAEFNNNATEKLDEYNQNAESLTNRIVECESENERLREDIKSIAIQGNATGENIHIEDSSNARCEVEICGNQSQDMREGYNLFDVLGLTLENQNQGVTIERNDDGYIIANGTPTSPWRIYLRDTKLNEKLEDGETYSLWQENYSEVDNGGIYLQIIANSISDGTTIYTTSSIRRNTFKVNKSKYIYQAALKISTLEVAGTFNNYKNRYMIYKGADNKKFEVYGASPSMNFSSEVKTVGSIKNILDMSSAKGGTSNGITCNINENGSYSYVGTAIEKAINVWLLGSYNNKNPIFKLEAGTYYIDGICLFEGNTIIVNPFEKKVITLIKSYEITGVRAMDAVVGQIYDEIKYPIIAKVDHEIPWIPYNCGFAKINIENKNRTNLSKVKLGTKNGITATYNANNDSITFNGTCTKDNTLFAISDNSVQIPYLNGKTTMTVQYVAGSSSGSYFGVRYYNDEYKHVFSLNVIELNKNNNKLSRTELLSGTYVGFDFRIDKDVILNNFTIQVMLTDEVDTDYIKHEEQSYLVDVQQEMLDGDKFIKQENKWYEKHNYEKIVVDGINYGNEYVFENGIFKLKDLIKSKDISNAKKEKDWAVTEEKSVFCTHLKTSNVHSMQKLNKAGITNTTDGGLLLKFDDTTAEDGIWTRETVLAKIKELYDAGTPIIIYYLLAEPILLECTEEQSKVLDEIYNKAHTYKSITNISAESAEINPILNVKYLKDTETEHNKLQAQIDEIKQLLSSTQTSALLLDNMQKDLESEV